MRLSVVLVASACWPFAAGFKVPPGTADGLYMVHANEAGDDIHIKLGEPGSETSNPNVDSGHSNNQRGDWRFWPGPYVPVIQHFGIYKCDSSITSFADAMYAVEALKDQCANNGRALFVEPRHHLYSVVNFTVAFFCNHSYDRNFHVHCHESDVEWVKRRLLNRCNGGWNPSEKGFRCGWMTQKTIMQVPKFDIGVHLVDERREFCGEKHR